MADPRTIVKTFGYTGKRQSITMEFSGTCTAYLWGAGGGAGGADASSFGGAGSSGLHNSTTFTFVKGDVIEVSVGKGGTGGESNAPSAKGGVGGDSRLRVGTTEALSFNGGDGSAAGPIPYSGGGGGGGGATVVTQNEIVVCVAGGGGGGGGAGNDVYAGANKNRGDILDRRTASIVNNATGAYNPNSKALDITNSQSYTKNPGVTISNYNNFQYLSQSPEDNTTLVCVFGWGSIAAGDQIRVISTNSKVNLSLTSILTYYVNRGTEADWGQAPESNEVLTLQYSFDNVTWNTIDTVTSDVPRNAWVTRSVVVPWEARTADGVYLRYRQVTQSASSTRRRDTWAMTSVYTGQSVLDCRGENGQQKTADGGGAGGGGGGYPGGQGGAVYPGDASGYAGQTGGNYPINESFYRTGTVYAIDIYSPRYRHRRQRWSSFMRNYAVWPFQYGFRYRERYRFTGTYDVYRTFNAPYTGTYQFLFSADRNGELYLDGNRIIVSSNHSAQPTPVNVNLSQGTHQLRFVLNNSRGFGGVSLLIQDSVGGRLWDTRTHSDVDPPGSDNRYYNPGHGRGGPTTGASGENGYAVLVIEPSVEFASASAVKLQGKWRQISAGYVKVGGSWKQITDAYIKKDGKWVSVISAGDESTVQATEITNQFGKSSRPYS